MKKDTNEKLNPTKKQKNNQKQDKKATKNTQQDNGLTNGMKWFQILSTGLSSFMRGMCWMMVVVFMGTVMWWIWTGTIPPSDVVDMGKKYLGIF
ncbi:hypothetical protein F7731_23835 [Cytobacillus depressus]|uniref:Uncharacterized protein n=1 Tax=Cytobacillus depressus TaxID=1602942 RepID=A0A6L3UY69_9BACI|nr:hypothetical protein [Cytobacillus depressus]KAB2328984.1 hypothetical protein F7731_23835 [Cytobacillus depressus]